LFALCLFVNTLLHVNPKFPFSQGKHLFSVWPPFPPPVLNFHPGQFFRKNFSGDHFSFFPLPPVRAVRFSQYFEPGDSGPFQLFPSDELLGWVLIAISGLSLLCLASSPPVASFSWFFSFSYTGPLPITIFTSYS